jgi:hypothetical protein
MMLCLPCQPGKPEPHDCEARKGAITPCECPVCFPPGAATQGDDESVQAYANRLLAEHGFKMAIEQQMSLESAELPPRQHRKPADVDTKGRL